MIEKVLKSARAADLIPYENNPRHNDKAVADVMESIRQCENLDPIEVDENYVILAGHTRQKALLKLGIETTDIIQYIGLTEEQKRKYRLLSNKTGEKADWDLDKLAKELDDLDFGDFDFGFANMVDLDADLEIRQDEPPDLPEQPTAKVGDMYRLGRHYLLCGDATNLDDVKRLVAGASMDMFLTYPPYNVDYEGTAGKIKNDHMTNDAFRAFLADSFSNAAAVLKKGGAFHIWHADSEGYNFRGACIDAGLKVRQCLIWEKDQLVLGRQDFQWIHEPCLYGEKPPEFPEVEEYEDEYNHVSLYGWKDGGKHYWFKNRKQTTILKFDRPKKSADHPTMKPVALFAYQMQCNTKMGQKVLDLFAGSGTTLIAAQQTGRTAYLMELDPRFVDVIVQRYEAFTGEKAELL